MTDFPCGHPGTEENTYVLKDRAVCARCRREAALRSYHRNKHNKTRRPYDPIANRRKILPDQYEAAVMKVEHLRREAARLGIDLENRA